MKRCACCEQLTYGQCIECGDPLCFGHGMKICPMCRRIKLFKWEQAQARRVVYWQYVEVPLHIRVPGRVDLGAITEPMETLLLEC